MDGHLFNTIIPTTLVDVLRWRSQYQPHRLAFRYLLDGETKEVHLTYKELDQQARAISGAVRRHTSSGGRALLLYPPGLDFVSAFLGCLYAGAIAVPAFSPQTARPERIISRLSKIVYDAQSSLILTTSSLRSRLALMFRPATDLRSISLLATDDISIDLAEEWRKPSLNKDQLAYLQYSSGSTSKPKGIMVTHRNLLHNLSIVQHCFEHNSATKMVNWAPFYHDMGLVGGILQSFSILQEKNT